MLTVLPRTLRVHSLTGRITLDTLHQAFKAVKRHHGAAGLDKQSITMVASNLEENLLALRRDMKSGTSQPIPLRRVSIPQGPGKCRPLGIPTVRCRVAQEVIRALIEPIFAPTFHDSSHGFRRRRSCHTAMAQRVELHQQGYRVVVEADLKGFFDSIPHHRIRDLVASESADGNILNLITKFLQAGVMDEGEVRPTWKGTPQGGRLEARGYKFVRYADDLVVLCTTKRQAEKALAAVTAIVEDDLGWQVNPDKTHLTTCGQGCDVLGYHVTTRTIRLGGQAEERFTRKIKECTRRRHNLDTAVVRKINRVIRGTVRYFATALSTCLGQCNGWDRWIRMRIRCRKYKRIWKTDTRRLQSRHISRMGCVLCREVSGEAREGEGTTPRKGQYRRGRPV